MTTKTNFAAGQVLIGGTYGTTLSPTTKRRLVEGRLAGLILMGRNIDSPEQVREMLVAAGDAAAPGFPKPLLGVDQEGGRVARLKAPIVQLPPARQLGCINDRALTLRAYDLLGRHLRALGFSFNFAPVLDIDGGPAREVIGDRSFGGDPAIVRRHGAAAIEGLLQAGICPCGKHFPGHGVTNCDSHESLPVVRKDLDELMAREILPFAAAIKAGLPMVMPAHVIYSGIDRRSPATFSPSILDVLRKELGFQGVIVTDDLKMGAVTDAGGAVDVAVEALMAGADLLLCCHDEDLQEEICEAIADGARRSPALSSRLEEAAARNIELRRRFIPAPASAEELNAILVSKEGIDVKNALDGHLG